MGIHAADEPYSAGSQLCTLMQSAKAACALPHLPASQPMPDPPSDVSPRNALPYAMTSAKQWRIYEQRMLCACISESLVTKLLSCGERPSASSAESRPARSATRASRSPASLRPAYNSTHWFPCTKGVLKLSWHLICENSCVSATDRPRKVVSVFGMHAIDISCFYSACPTFPARVLA